jgi:hypothetical protein
MAEPKLAMINVVEHPQSGWQLGVVAKRTYRVVGGACHVAEEQIPLVEAPLLVPDSRLLLHDADIALNRTQVDVIVLGKARAPLNQRVFDAEITVGALNRTIRVFGDRRCWRDPSGKIRIGDPAPVEEVDLSWTASYGGVDQVALNRLGDPMMKYCAEQGEPCQPHQGLFAYPRNPLGKGYLIEASEEGISQCQLPNLEDPACLLTGQTLVRGATNRWPGAAIPICTSWLPYTWFPRSAQVGLPLYPYDDKTYRPEGFFEVKRGFLKPVAVASNSPVGARQDVAAAQQSALQMRVDALRPGEGASLLRIHPRFKSWAFTLPKEVPYVAVQMPDEKPTELRPAIRTVLLEPNEDRVCLVWTAELRQELPIGPGKLAKIRFGVRWQS